MWRPYAVLAAIMLLGAPIVHADDDGGADENATWGLCQAQDSFGQGGNSSNHTVSNTPPFNDTDEEDCENAEHPANGTPGEDYPPEDPGAPDDPGQDPPNNGSDDENGPDDPGQGPGDDGRP